MLTSTKPLTLSLALALLPPSASAINCEFGCKGTGCYSVLTAASINGAAPMQYRFDRAFALPPLGAVTGFSSPEVNDVCDQIVLGSINGSLIAYAERSLVSMGARRHRVDFDLSGVRAQVHSGTGARSWWHGMVTWIIPMQSTPWGSDLRLDYSGGFVAPWLHYQPRLRLVLDEAVVAEVGLSTTQVAVELIWSDGGPLSVVVAEFAGTPPNRKAAPIQRTEIELPDTEGYGFRPTHVVVGRSGGGAELRSTGVLSAASYLVLPPIP